MAYFRANNYDAIPFEVQSVMVQTPEVNGNLTIYVWCVSQVFIIQSALLAGILKSKAV